ncbi:hypothetical protein LCGC14_0425510 [marine sediment metagenome]|uniref:Uncharacterized protein n=1 Tax=marine sediment metagenome TaxID=412755 RepID=A0A0F9SVP4_9ZZZZ
MITTINRYCSECLTRTKQHCVGKDSIAGNAAPINEVCVWSADGEGYEIKSDYMQAGAASGSGSNRLHGLNFCAQYMLDLAQLPKMKSAQTIRDEFNAQRAANKAATKAEKDAAKAEKANDKKQKAKQKAKQKTAERKAVALKQKIADGQRAAERATQNVMQPETTSQAVMHAMEIDEDFSDLII